MKGEILSIETAERIAKLEKENKELKKDLLYVLNQTLGAFVNQWCIDWNFTDIREKYNLGCDEDE